MESVLCLTLSMLGLQSSGRPRFFWEEAGVPGSLKTLRSACDGALSLRGAEIEFAATVVAQRESLLEGAILGVEVVLYLSVGNKGENDGLESTGLVGGGEQRADEAAKAGMLWSETTAFVTSGVYNEPRELWSRLTCCHLVQSSPSPPLATCRARESTEGDRD